MTPLTAERAKQVFDSLFDLAVDRHEEGKIEEALKIFQSLCFIDPRDFGVWQAMAQCHEDLHQPAIAAMMLSFGEQIQEAVAS